MIRFIVAIVITEVIVEVIRDSGVVKRATDSIKNKIKEKRGVEDDNASEQKTERINDEWSID